MEQDLRQNLSLLNCIYFFKRSKKRKISELGTRVLNKDFAFLILGWKAEFRPKFCLFKRRCKRCWRWHRKSTYWVLSTFISCATTKAIEHHINWYEIEILHFILILKLSFTLGTFFYSKISTLQIVTVFTFALFSAMLSLLFWHNFVLLFYS